MMDMDMPDGDAIVHVMQALQSLNVFGSASHIDEMRPLDFQFAMGVGDKAVLSATDADHGDFIAVEVIDPAEHAEEFPDWEDRLLNSYLLCRWRSRHDSEGDTGWFARVRMIQISNEQFQEIQGWFNKTFPRDFPDWLMKAYEDFTDQLSQQAPENIPTKATCELCGSRQVEIHAVETVVIAAIAGEVRPHGQKRYVALTDKKMQTSTEAHLHCISCNGRANLEDHEYIIKVD